MAHDPEAFKAKLAFWREHGMPSPTFSGGRDAFHNEASVHQRERDHVAQLKAAGVSFDRAK